MALIYANHAGTSWPKPPGVAEAMDRALRASPLETGAIYDDAHATIAHFLGIPTPERLVLTPSCTAALSIVIPDLRWEPDDIVVTSSLEHHALARPVHKLTWERDVEHVQLDYTAGTPVDLAQLTTTLDTGRVRLVALTGASNVTGERLPIEEIVDLAHRHDALVLLDAAQLAGIVPIDVAALGVDLLVFAGHKGPLGPLGIGGFWAAPHVGFICPSATCELDGGTHGKPSPFPSFCDVGSVNLPAAAGLAASLRWIAAEGVEHISNHACGLAARLRDALLERPHCRVLGGTGPRTATVGFRLETLPLAETEAHFRERAIIVRAGSHCAPMALETLGVPDGTIRISFGATNQPDDVDAILAAIDDLPRA